MLLRRGRLITAGPLADDGGGLFVSEAESPQPVSTRLTGDPFPGSDVFQALELKAWTLVFSHVELLRTG